MNVQNFFNDIQNIFFNDKNQLEYMFFFYQYYNWIFANKNILG